MDSSKNRWLIIPFKKFSRLRVNNFTLSNVHNILCIVWFNVCARVLYSVSSTLFNSVIISLQQEENIKRSC